jgi:hypothetical protein
MTAEQTWAARVSAWRASGWTAAEFCEGRDIKVGSLRYWASRLGRAEASATPTPEPTPPREVRIARVVRAGTDAGDTPVVLEVGGVRVALRRGFDREVLRAALDVLAERSS